MIASVIALLQIIVRLLPGLVDLIVQSVRSRRSIEAENVFLCRALALFKERCIRPRRLNPARRLSLTFLSRLFDWRDALVMVRPVTMIRWHRAGWRPLWRVKSRPGRPRIPVELRQRIRRMATGNQCGARIRRALRGADSRKPSDGPTRQQGAILGTGREKSEKATWRVSEPDIGSRHPAIP